MTVSKASLSKLQYTTPIADIPNPPTIDSVSSTGSVAFTASDKGGAATSFTVTSNPGSYSVSSATSPINMETSGISDNTSYVYNIKATSSSGDSTTDSSASTLMTLLPAVPTSVSATLSGNTSGVVAFTPGAGGRTPTLFRAISTPGGLTATSATSPITVTGLTGGTSYTFTVRAQAPALNSAESSATNSITATLPAYTLAQTYNGSATFTVPAGTQQIAVLGVGSGANGGGGNGSGGSGGSGGASGAAFVLRDYAVTPAATYSVVIGGAGGVTSFGSLITANSGGNVTSNVTLETNRAAVGGGGGGGGGPRSYSGGNGGGGTTGTAQAAITTNAPGVNAFAVGGSGGGGGGGGVGGAGYQYQGGGAGGGGSPFGGSGGNGGTGNNQGNGIGAGSGNQAGAGSQPGGGGGGGGGGGFAGTTGGTGSSWTVGSGGGAGAGGAGRILVYTR
jgi:large repetitive protein